MLGKRLILPVALAGLMLVGCEQSSSPPPPARPTPPAAGTGAADAEKQAQDLLAKAKGFLDEKKFTEAEDALKKVQAMKDKLSAATQKQLDDLMKLVDAAKAVPAVPKLPG